MFQRLNICKTFGFITACSIDWYLCIENWPFYLLLCSCYHSAHVVFTVTEEAAALLPLHKNRQHEALENGQYEEASRRIKHLHFLNLIECFENYAGYSPPSYKSSLHLIAGLRDEDQATGLCQQLLNKVKKVENREHLLNATVVEQFTFGPRNIRARVAAIHIAAYHGNIGVVKVLCEEYGVDINCSTSETLEGPTRQKGLTPLYWAAVNGQTELVQKLIDITGVNTSCSDDGDMALHVASMSGHIELVILLLEHQADVNASNHTDGVTPLYVAARNGHTEVVKLLVDHNADVNASRHTDGATSLYVAAQNGHTEVVRLLVDHNADVNASRHTGVTPLHVATLNGHTEVVKLLIDNNADSEIECFAIKTIDVAKRKCHFDIVELLQ